MSGLKALANKKVQKDVKFMGEDLTMTKLSVAQVLEIQDKSKVIQDSKDDADNFETVKTVIKYAVEEANELTDDEFNSLPLDDLIKLSNEIMVFSGIKPEEAGK